MIFHSKFNGTIKLTKNWRGKPSVWVGGFEQSGPNYVEKLWSKALRHSGLSRINSVLVLGLGCGTIVKIINDLWPEAKIVGVEIDPVMIEIGRKYFGLSDLSNLKIVQSEANEYIKCSKDKFDLIICDAYLGGKIQLLKLKKSKATILSNELNSKTLTNQIVLTPLTRGGLVN